MSARVDITVSASFEFAAMLGKGETLRSLEISVSELLDHSERGQRKHRGFLRKLAQARFSHHDVAITFFPREGEVVSSCSSLFLSVERRNSNVLGRVPSEDDISVGKRCLF